MFAALAVSQRVEHLTGWTISRFVKTLRRYRSVQINGHDEVQDDIEDARSAELARADEASASYEDMQFSDTGEDVVSE